MYSPVMAMLARRSPEEKAAAEAEEMKARQRRAWEASSADQAQAARERGDGFFQVEILHNEIRGVASAMWTATAGSRTKQQQVGGATDVLSEIEAQGWALEHASWVYVQTGQDSRDKFLASGQQVAIRGDVVGIYLFRRRG